MQRERERERERGEESNAVNWGSFSRVAIKFYKSSIVKFLSITCANKFLAFFQSSRFVYKRKMINRIVFVLLRTLRAPSGQPTAVEAWRF